MNDVPTKNPARRSFTDEFKADAVQLVVQGNRPIAQVARELEINESSLGYWVKTYRRGSSPRWWCIGGRVIPRVVVRL